MQNAFEAKPVKNAALARASVSIRPYLSGASNLGLEKYNQVLFDGARQKDPVILEGSGRIKTYITGLNELAPEVQSIQDKDVKLAKILDIRQFVARLENELAGNFKISPTTCMDNYGTAQDTFWANVDTFKSVIPDTFDNDNMRVPTWWDDLFVELDNNGIALKITELRDELIYRIAQAGGFSLVAKNYTEAAAGGYKFYLDKIEDTAKLGVNKRKIRNEAGALLDNLYKKDSNKLFYITKLISIDSTFFKDGKNSTPLDILYEECSKFIDGEGRQKNKVEACEEFIKLADKSSDIGDLKIRCIIKDTSAMSILAPKGDGQLYYMKYQEPLGKTIEDVVIYLKNSLNERTYKELLDEAEKIWRE